ncbi:MAG: BsuPI-related putative proteinase inhibitor [Candidatus Kapabacteria bacterium]|jgi:hypothetical protein|nr:BsuPI-related putative proteinase inhibitor [Candidatus Kapabacteria bacterium]
MKALPFCVALAASIVVLAGCSRGFVSPYNVRGLFVDDTIFTMRGSRMPDSSVRFWYVINPRIRTSDPTIRWVEMEVSAQPTDIPDTINLPPRNLGVEGVDDVIRITGEDVWSTAAAKQSNKAYAVVSVVTASNHLKFRQEIPYETAKPVELFGYVQRGPDSTVELGVHATRVFRPSDEYLPSSERFRVIISDKKGNVIWRSDAGMNFLTAVGQVEPQVAGRSERYKVMWKGADLQANPAPPGEYEAELIIPSRPQPYRTRIAFRWPMP